MNFFFRVTIICFIAPIFCLPAQNRELQLHERLTQNDFDVFGSISQKLKENVNKWNTNSTDNIQAPADGSSHRDVIHEDSSSTRSKASSSTSIVDTRNSTAIALEVAQKMTQEVLPFSKWGSFFGSKRSQEEQKNSANESEENKIDVDEDDIEGDV